MKDPPHIFDTLGTKPNFVVPVKKIHDSQGTLNFQRSIAHRNLATILDCFLFLVSFTECSSEMLDGKIVEFSVSQSDKPSFNLPAGFKPQPDSSKGVEAVIALLDHLLMLVKETPPIEGPTRYGNPACRDFHKKFKKSLNRKLQEVLIDSGLYTGACPSQYLEEISYYFLNAFGSEVRLDYGTGHELSFMAFVGALWMSDVLVELDGVKILTMFCRYYDVVRTLILAYTLEPAGSHGVWGLDDHFHLIYLLGAAQFSDVADIVDLQRFDKHQIEQQRSRKKAAQISITPPPKSVVEKNTLPLFNTKNLYFNAVSFIYKVKHGPFWETSPILYDVSGIKSWKKILTGLRKMYFAEVLGKFPVVQHFWFGGVFYPWIDIDTNKTLPEILPANDQESVSSKIHSPQKVSPMHTTFATSSRINPTMSTTPAPWAQNHNNLVNHRKPGLYNLGNSSKR